MWLVSLVVILLVATLCVMLGAHVVGARQVQKSLRLAAMVVCALITGFALHHFHGLGLGLGLILGILIDALIYMLVLDTSYPRGLIVALIQHILPWLVATVLLAALFGGVMHGLHQLTHDAPFRLDLPSLRV
jgi:hypothetical protein